VAGARPTFDRTTLQHLVGNVAEEAGRSPRISLYLISAEAQPTCLENFVQQGFAALDPFQTAETPEHPSEQVLGAASNISPVEFLH